MFRVCYLWSAPDYSDRVYERQTYTSKAGEWKCVFQPCNDYRSVALLFFRVDRTAITRKTIQKDIDKVNSLVMSSFASVLEQTGQKWFKTLNTVDVSAVLNVVKEPTLSDDRKTLKMTFEFSGVDTQDGQQYWYQLDLAKWLHVEKVLSEADYAHMLDWMKTIDGFCEQPVQLEQATEAPSDNQTGAEETKE